ncbi:MAG: pentapeptide repeat-containing protein [Polyangiaceae bacterium]|nr:pentapeptide repeat-containing protein [Polyangiaceae bacterium]
MHGFPRSNRNARSLIILVGVTVDRSDEAQLGADPDFCVVDHDDPAHLAVLAPAHRAGRNVLLVHRRVLRSHLRQVAQSGVGHPPVVEIETRIRVHRLHPIEVGDVRRACLADGGLAPVLVSGGIENGEHHARRQRHEELEPLQCQPRAGGITREDRVVLGALAARSATFRGADLTDAVLDGADLMHASFEGACLRRARLRGASLYEAEVYLAKLDGADLSGAIIAKTKLSG